MAFIWEAWVGHKIKKPNFARVFLPNCLIEKYPNISRKLKYSNRKIMEPIASFTNATNSGVVDS